MKNFFIASLLLISSSLLAASEDYVCNVDHYWVDLNLTQDTSTHIWFYEGNVLLGQNYSSWVEKVGDQSTYHFHLGFGEPVKLTFKTIDAEAFPDPLVGRIFVSTTGMYINSKIRCRKLRP